MAARALGLTLAILLLAAACGDDEDEPRCTAGAARACLCGDGATLGEQICNDDQRSHTPCAPCPAAMGGQGGTAGSGGSAGAGGN